MSQLILTRGNSVRRGVRRSTLSKNVYIGTFSLMVLLILFVCLMSILFLVHYNNMATKGYVLKRLEVERQALLAEQEIKDMHLAEITSLEALKNRDKVAAMYNVNDKMFIMEETGIAIK